MKKLTLFLILLTSICFAQRKETISGTFYNIYYPNGEHLFNYTATHTIPSQRGHIEVNLRPEMQMSVSQTEIDGRTTVVPRDFLDTGSKTHIIYGPYGGPDYKIELSYPLDKMVNQTIVYNIDFYYYDSLYGADIEPNDTMETAIPMSENTSYQGWGNSHATYNQNQYDYYKVTAAKRGIYTLTALIDNTLGNGNMTNLLYKGDKLHYNTYETEAGTKSTLKVFCVDKGDEFYVLAASGLNSYKLNYTIEESIDENDMEPNNTIDEAIEISENTKINGTIGYGELTGLLPKDFEDYYKIVPSKNGKLIIEFKEKIEVEDNLITFYVKDTNGQLSTIDTKALTVNNQTFEIDCASTNKTYYAILNKSKFFAYPNYSCCNAYEISWNMQDTANTGCGFLDTADFNFNDGLNIFPNPATDILQLKVKNNQTINQITIRDITGKTVMSPTFNNNTVDIKKLNSGIYFLQAKINDKTVTQKFIKK
jgi:hypothetical protein